MLQVYYLSTYPTLIFHSTPWPISSPSSDTKRTHIIMHGTCLSGLYPCAIMRRTSHD
ncbi:BCN_G0016800.mRNA.1.CDS.1 [Saccharomyces cerevisiae]|nr:BCN_G0016800.mRNA.1.CDS.1 [Saccharomyces cerevisiae]CAI7149405.1 BCN_G0016800.mRNA.1.CDS.1 [Saccharomyces cerevisiae]